MYCPITRDIMDDPVTASDGKNYERAAIVKWLVENDTSPSTNLPLASKTLTTNHELRKRIDEELHAMREDLLVDYAYDERDFEAILVSRLIQSCRESTQQQQQQQHFSPNVYVSRTVTDMNEPELAQRLADDKREHAGTARVSLFPCKFSDTHLVVVLIRFAADGAIRGNVEYIESMPFLSVQPKVRTQVERVYSNAKIAIVPDDCQQLARSSNAAAASASSVFAPLIESLVRLVVGGADTRLGSHIARMQIECLSCMSREYLTLMHEKKTWMKCGNESSSSSSPSTHAEERALRLLRDKLTDAAQTLLTQLNEQQQEQQQQQQQQQEQASHNDKSHCLPKISS